MRAALEPMTMLGLAGVAVWLYVRFPRLRPKTVVGAIAHVAASFFIFGLLPYGLRLLKVLPPPTGLLVFVVGLLLPSLCYVLLSWLWLIARLHDLTPPPRGGHRVPLPTRN